MCAVDKCAQCALLQKLPLPPKQCSINLCTASRRIHLHAIEQGHKIKLKKKKDPDEAFVRFVTSRWQCCFASRVTNRHGAGWLFIGFLLFLGWGKKTLSTITGHQRLMVIISDKQICSAQNRNHVGIIQQGCRTLFGIFSI